MKYGLIGKTLSHSYSKVIHGFFGNHEYELLELPPESLEDFLRAADFLGINVTIPYKETVMPYCVPDEHAKKIGSVNTIVNKNGTLYGYNTDYFGFSYMAKLAGISFNGRKVVILGSGGTSKTAVSVTRDGGAREIAVVSRNGENNYGNIERHADCDVLVNTTPVGMFPNNGDSPLSLDNFTKLSAVIDVVYNPLRTKLLLEAKKTGIRTASGLSMLTAQALRAHNLFFGIETNEREDLMSVEEALSKTEKRFSNIVLTGMPGCGKTTMGRELAKVFGKDFVDTDELIAKRTGRKPRDILREDGEPRFREHESAVIAQAAAKTNQVIATGGGSVLAEENRDALAQNGIVIFMDRPLDRLAIDGRPLSVNLEALYQRRLPIYESFCQYKITLDDDFAANVRRIKEALAFELSS
jgi:shikimate dehydrogenase